MNGIKNIWIKLKIYGWNYKDMYRNIKNIDEIQTFGWNYKDMDSILKICMEL